MLHQGVQEAHAGPAGNARRRPDLHVLARDCPAGVDHVDPEMASIVGLPVQGGVSPAFYVTERARRSGEDAIFSVYFGAKQKIVLRSRWCCRDHFPGERTIVVLKSRCHNELVKNRDPRYRLLATVLLAQVFQGDVVDEPVGGSIPCTMQFMTEALIMSRPDQSFTSDARFGISSGRRVTAKM